MIVDKQEMNIQGEIDVDPIQLGLNKKAQRKSLMLQVLPFVGLLFVFVFFLFGTGGKLVASSNLANLVEQCFTVTVVAVGVSFVYACGCMDVSVGAVMAFSELIMGYMMLAAGIPTFIIIIAGVGIAVGLVLITGAITTFLRVPTFVISLCIMNICTGIVTTAVSQSELYTPYQEYSHFNGTIFRIVALVSVVVIGLIIFNRTRLGRDLKAIGGNAVAAQQSGVRKHKTILLGFVCMGVCIGVAGFFALARTGVVNAATGSGLGLNLLVAIVLGGFPLTGGANARMIGAIVGAFTVTVLTNGLALMGIDSALSSFVKGMLFIVIVAISYERSKGKEVQ